MVGPAATLSSGRERLEEVQIPLGITGIPADNPLRFVQILPKTMWLVVGYGNLGDVEPGVCDTVLLGSKALLAGPSCRLPCRLGTSLRHYSSPL